MSSTGITSPVNAAIHGSNGNGGQIVKIIKLPATINNSAKAIRLEGQVTSQSTTNGTVNIQTEQGNVEVKVAGRNQPQLGQKIEIDIPARNQQGQQPRQATIRTDTPQQNINNTPRGTPTSNNPTLPSRITTPTTNQTGNTPAQQNTQAPQTNQPPQNTANVLQNARTTATAPLPPAIQESATSQTSTTIPQPARTITSDSLLRLLSVSPAQAQNIAKDFTFALPQPTASIIDKTVFRALVTTANISNQINPTTVLQTPPPLTTQVTQTFQKTQQAVVINTNGAQTQPLLQALNPAQITPATLQNTTTLPPIISNTTQALLTSQTLSPNVATEILAQTTPTAPQNASLIPVTFDPANPTQNNAPRLGQIDIQITKITPPDAVLKPFNATTPNLLSPPSVPAATKFPPPITGVNTATSLSAQITGFTTQGLPLVTVQGVSGRLPQSFILQQAAPNLTLGTQLQITPKNGTPIAGQFSPLAAQATSNPLLRGFQWPAINTLLNTLQQLNPQAASSLTRTLPNAGQPAQIGAASMVFIAAVKSGNFDMLLGDKKLDMLQQAGKRSILSSLTQDTGRAGAPEPATQNEWRAVPMPMFWDNEIHKITLYTRNENQNNNQENNGEGQTRFIFDLNLTRMGDVQIDGLIKDKRLDLILRTQNAFSEPMQQTMRQAYSGALNQADLTGELNFQGSTKNWVHVLEKEEQLGVNI